MNTLPVGDAPAPRGGIAARVGAGVAGLLVVLVAAVLTLGSALAAPIGVGIAWWVMRRRGRPLTRGWAWVAAASASTLAIALAFAVLVAALPRGALENAMADAEARQDSSRPEWVERMAPSSAPQNAAAERIVESKPAQIYFGLIGVGLASLFFGTIAGSAGWGATMLGGYAATGRWLPKAEPAAAKD
jgi:hypothetical protein